MISEKGRDGASGVGLRTHDGGQYNQDVLPDSNSRQIYYELLRNLLKERRQELEEIAHWVPAELVFKALIIREFMEQQGIEDIRIGIRLFYMFQRRQLAQLKKAMAGETRHRSLTA